MRCVFIRAVVLVFVVGLVSGCSERTRRDAGEAMEKTGDTLQSAAEDTANVAEGAYQGATEAIEENEAKPDPQVP